MTGQPPPGWYPDPGVAQQLRYWDGAAWTDHVAPGEAQPQTSTGSSLPVADRTPGRDRNFTLWAGIGAAAIIAAVVVIVVSILAAAVGPNGTSSGPAAPRPTATQPSPTAPPSSAAPSPGSALSVTVIGVEASPALNTVRIGVKLTNTSDKPVTAVQLRTTATLPDPLGRTIELGPEYFDCVRNADPIAPGQSIEAYYEQQPSGSRLLQGVGKCTILPLRADDRDAEAFYQATNPFRKPQDPFYADKDPAISVTVQRVSFADGSGLGEAN